MNMQSFGSKLKSLIDAIPMTQSAFAEKVGIDRSRLSRILNDKLAPRTDEIRQFAIALGLSPEDLLQGLPEHESIHEDIRQFEELANRIIEEQQLREQLEAEVATLRTTLSEERQSHHNQLKELERDHQNELDQARLEHRQELDAELAAHRKSKGTITFQKKELQTLASTIRQLKNKISTLESQTKELRGQVVRVQQSGNNRAALLALLGVGVGAWMNKD